MIDESIRYKELAEYMRLALEEFEFYNSNVESFSFGDVINWLEHFYNYEANSRSFKKRNICN